MSWLESLPNYTAYGTPSYFIYLLIAVLPMGISLYFGKRLAWYEAIVSFLFIFFMFDGSSAPQMLSLIGYVVYQTILVMGYFHYRQKKNVAGVFYLMTLLSLLPIIIVKFTPAMVGHNSLERLSKRVMAPLKTSTGGSSSAFCCLCQPSLPDRLIVTGAFQKTIAKSPVVKNTLKWSVRPLNIFSSAFYTSSCWPTCLVRFGCHSLSIKH